MQYNVMSRRFLKNEVIDYHAVHTVHIQHKQLAPLIPIDTQLLAANNEIFIAP